MTLRYLLKIGSEKREKDLDSKHFPATPSYVITNGIRRILYGMNAERCFLAGEALGKSPPTIPRM